MTSNCDFKNLNMNVLVKRLQKLDEIYFLRYITEHYLYVVSEIIDIFVVYSLKSLNKSTERALCIYLRKYGIIPTYNPFKNCRTM